MRVQAGVHPNTHEWVLDDFTGGSCLHLPEETQRQDAPRCGLYVKDFEIGPGRSLVLRPNLYSVSLRDYDTGFPTDTAVLRLVRFERLSARPLWALVTPSGLFSFWPFYSGWNLRQVTLENGSPVFNESARRADVALLNGRLYVAAPNNYLVEWDGSNPAKQISTEWPKNYQKPSIIRRHAGRLLCTGFTDIADSRAASQVRATKVANTAELEDLYEEARTGDDDMPTAMASWMVSDMADATRAALVIFKRNSLHVALGTDWGTFQDVTFRTVSTLVGCTGPAAWCLTPKGIAFHDETGIFGLSGPGSEPEELSLPISPCWQNRKTFTNVGFPRVMRQGDEWVHLLYDAKRREVVCLLPMAVANG